VHKIKHRFLGERRIKSQKTKLRFNSAKLFPFSVQVPLKHFIARTQRFPFGAVAEDF